ncbi:MAG: hypothetical protein AAF517_02870 [Planctomycetota bacterium]
MAASASNRRRVRRLVVLLAAVGLVTCGSLVVGYWDVLMESWFGVRVVRTWRDLQRQPALDLGNGITVRLGIEAKEGPQLGGVLLYGLFERGSGDSTWSVRSGLGQLGPLRVLVSSVDEEPKELKVEKPAAQNTISTSGALKQRFFARRVDLSRPGPLRIEIRTPSGRFLRATTIYVKEATAHPWLAVRPRYAVVLRGPDWEHRLEPDPTALALPCWTGTAPLGSEATRKALAAPQSTELPRIQPSEFRLDLRRDRSREMLFTLRAPPGEKLNEVQMSQRLLARWKVNGRPYSPDPSAGAGFFIAPNNKTRWVDEVSLEFKLVPQIGAQAGDTITMQLLYADRGHLGQNAARFGSGKSAPNEGPGRVYLSQPIEFVLP